MHQVSKEIFLRVKKTINRVMFDLHKLPQFRPPSEKCTHVKRVHTLDDIQNFEFDISSRISQEKKLRICPQLGFSVLKRRYDEPCQPHRVEEN